MTLRLEHVCQVSDVYLLRAELPAPHPPPPPHCPGSLCFGSHKCPWARLAGSERVSNSTVSAVGS